MAQKMSPVAIKVFQNDPFEFQEDWGEVRGGRDPLILSSYWLAP